MKKNKQPELKTVDELDEEDSVERLKVNMHGADDGDGAVVDDIDSLLREERSLDDDALDSLFSDEKTNKYDEVEVEVRKALYQPKTSNAHLFRANKSAEVTKKTRSEEISKYKTVEDTWDGVIQEEAKAGKLVVYVAVALLGVLVFAGAWALWNVSKNDQVAHKDILDKQEQETLAQEKQRADAASEIKKLEAVLIQFADAEKPEDKLKFLHDSDSLKDQMMAFYQRPENEHPYEDLKIERVVEELINKHKVWTAICSYGHSGTQKHEFFFFHKEPSGDYTLDWKAMSGVQDDDWKTFVNEQSTDTIEIRAIVQPKIEDGHYNWGFKDDDYSAYKLIVSDEQIFWGYIKNDNKALVRKMNQTVMTMVAYQKIYHTLDLEMILKIKFQEGTHELNKQCVEITEIVSTHWLDLRGNSDETEAEENP